jgi:radical SAM family uncharacterized protein
MMKLSRSNPDELLLAVEKPSRYTGGEVNAVRKENGVCNLLFALAFPDTYEVGMSHLGLQILYAVLNGLPEVACERCFAPWPDRERTLRQHRLPLCSLESQRPLVAFDIVGFSLQYELSYTNVLTMLELGRIPLRREERDEGHPLIIAGGPCAFNPAPMSAFIDAFVIGEGEEAIAEIAVAVLAVRTRGGRRRDQLEALSHIEGVYVPALHAGGERIRKRIIADLDGWRLPLCPVVPLMKTIHDRVTLEIARGCTRGCRFCQAGMVWRPVRERTPAVLEEMAEAMLRATGHDEISLLSLSSGDYTLIEPLLTTLMDRYYARRVALALPSLRVETLTSRLIEGIRRVRKTSFTLAPEAGTQRLRDVINKGNTEEELLETTERVFAAGWRAVKLYFMLGLPGEREEDLEGIVDLAYKTLRTAKRRGQVTVSLSTFVPKPHTPFQWQRQIGIEETAARQDFFRLRLKNRNISIKWHDARMSLLEGVLSRGGEEAGILIERAFRLGSDSTSGKKRCAGRESIWRPRSANGLRQCLFPGRTSKAASAGTSSFPRPKRQRQANRRLTAGPVHAISAASAITAPSASSPLPRTPLLEPSPPHSPVGARLKGGKWRSGSGSRSWVGPVSSPISNSLRP